MKKFVDDPSRIVILGAGAGGTSMLEMLLQEELVDVVAIVDRNPEAPGLVRAAELGIPTYAKVEDALQECAPCIAFNLTADEKVETAASEILGKGCVIGCLETRLLWKMITDLREAKEKLEFQATHDELTGLYNRRHMIRELERELNQSIRYGVALSVALIDLDQFKKVNDVHGHSAGDVVLRHVAENLKHHARTSDVIGRWGGEEFLALLPLNNLDSATHAVAKWLEALRSTSIMTPSGEKLTITFSAGVAEFRQEEAGTVHELIDRLLSRADERLYIGKRSGRARIVNSG